MAHEIPVEEEQATALTAAVASLLRQFKLEPGLLAGSAYSDLHANDIGLLATLGEANSTVQGLAQSLGAPVSTISSALDRLEGRGLISRSRMDPDRRVVVVALASQGQVLSQRLQEAQITNSRNMLARLPPKDRQDLVRLMAMVAQENR
jgi:DNA-binding MarR family transcriptional regulator